MAHRAWTEADLAAKGYYIPNELLPTDTPEGTLLARIRHLAKTHGWLTYHTHDSRKSESGFPDLVLTDGVSLLMYELKTNTGKPTVEQERWLHLLAYTDLVECGIWRPRDFGSIEARLTKRNR